MAEKDISKNLFRDRKTVFRNRKTLYGDINTMFRNRKTLLRHRKTMFRNRNTLCVELHLIDEEEEGNERLGHLRPQQVREKHRKTLFDNSKTMFCNRRTLFRNRKTLLSQLNSGIGRGAAPD